MVLLSKTARTLAVLDENIKLAAVASWQATVRHYQVSKFDQDMMMPDFY